MKIRKIDVNFNNNVLYNLDNILIDAANGRYPIRLPSEPNPITSSILRESNLFGFGTKAKLGQDRMFAYDPNERNVVTLSPKSSILLKKKVFSNFKNNNDIQWLDKTEKMLLRATKALFAYKVTQIRAYESLSKIETFYQKTGELNLTLLVELFNNSRFLATNNEQFVRENTKQFQSFRDEVLLILERNAFASDVDLTTWIVDPNDTDNYGVGPGTGVIELATYNEFDTSVDLNSNPNNASLTLQDPYRIMYISEGDIELAIEEAITGAVGLLRNLGNPATPVDSRTIVSSGLEIMGLGGLDSDININYIRDRLRVFYLGKPIANPGDSIHFFIRGNRTVEDFSKNFSTFDRDYLSIDQSILEAERVLFTNGKLDFETYKNLRQFSDASFGMRHVWAGVVKQTSESWGNGQWTVKVDCEDNMTWLTWSRYLEEPTIQNVTGVLEDPLTPYEIKKDATNTVVATGAPELLEENKRLIRSGLLAYDSGLLNGQFATEGNLLQGQYNYSGSISGKKIIQHPNGLVYRWKEGIFAVSSPISSVDTSNESVITQRQYQRYYSPAVAQNVLNNLDIANILSILIVGQPYNMEKFIEQSYQALNITNTSGDLKSTDPLSGVVNTIRTNNKFLGNFQPYRLITMSSETLLQSSNNSTLKAQTNENIKKLRERIIKIDVLIEKLTQDKRARITNKTTQNNTTTTTSFDVNVSPIANNNDFIIRGLQAERETIQRGIREQINLLNGSGNVSSKDILTQNINLFGKMKTLPLTGNYSGDHQLTRAMTLLGAQRRIEDVRLNRDKNLFIVSDQYDELTDIRPLLLQIGKSDYRLFKGEFVHVFDKCNEATSSLNLEFFCNTQGHLEFRPPQWNKTPVSILERLFDISKRSGKKIVPDFLTEAFQTRIGAIKREIHYHNIRIVILSLLLDKFPDRTIIPNFSPNIETGLDGRDDVPNELRVGNSSLKFFGVTIEPVSSKSDTPPDLSLKKPKFPFSNAQIRNTNFRNRFMSLTMETKLAENGDILYGDTDTLLGEFDPLFQEVSGLASNVLTIASRPSGFSAIEVANPDNLNYIRESFTKLSGMDPAAGIVGTNGLIEISDFIYSTEDLKPGENNIDKASKYLKLLQETISKRDSLVTILKRHKVKLDELEDVENILSGEFSRRSSGSFSNFIDRSANVGRTISDIFTGDATKGSLFDHLVEDDGRNLLGPGSGRRFIIRDEEITSCSFQEVPPEHCRISFTGDAPIIGADLNQKTEQLYYWAGVVDYDLWRQYGFKDGGSKSLPFANDAETVTKPYAILDIQLQRVKINQGSVTLIGNEYYEPGDIVYISTKELLYYVRSVSHSYSYSGQFTTTLTLEWGHPPGTYLPSPLDVLGQQYSKDSLNGAFLTYRNAQGDDSYKVLQPDCCLVFPTEIAITEENLPILLSHRDNAVRLTNIISELNSLIIGNKLVLIRGFATSDSEIEMVQNNISIVKKLLQNPVSLTKEGTSPIEDINEFNQNISTGYGVQIGNRKEVRPMQLPTGAIITPIKDEKIAEQIVRLYSTKASESSNNEFTVRVFNPEILSKQTLKNKEVSVQDYLSVFPKGGPKQRTWLDIRGVVGDFINTGRLEVKTNGVSNVIEIGILDIERAINS